MPDPIIDRDAIIEKAAKAEWVACWPKVPWSDDAAGEWLRITAAAIEPIADDLLAPIVALHVPHRHGLRRCINFDTCREGGRCQGCGRLMPCPTAQAVAAIREAVRA